MSELRDIGRSPGKSSLFFLMDWHAGIRLAGDRVECHVTNQFTLDVVFLFSTTAQ